CIVIHLYRDPRALHSFPTRRSSDLIVDANVAAAGWLGAGRKRLLGLHAAALERDGALLATQLAQPPDIHARLRRVGLAFPGSERDRKSTRLNSSHVKISYAVFCVKK